MKSTATIEELVAGVKATSEGTGLVGVHVNYRQNVKLFEQVFERSIL